MGSGYWKWMVRLGARWLLRTDPELALYGRFVVSQRLAAEQFEFAYPQLPAALAEILETPAIKLRR